MSELSLCVCGGREEVKMARILPITLLLLFLAISVESVIDCQKLDFSDPILPIPGSDLPYCSLEDTAQCCTESHLLRMKANITEDLITGMQEDLHATTSLWMDAYSFSKATIDEFLSIFIDIFPFPHHLSPVASFYLNNTAKVKLFQQLHPNYAIDLMFDFESYITNMTATLIEIFTQSIPYEASQKQCLQDLIHNHVDTDSIQKTGEGFRILQLIFQSLRKIEMLLNRFDVLNTTAYYPSEQCLESIITQYCAQCVRLIPPLCESTCVQVYSACQSPLHESLLPQFEALWNISRQLVFLTQSLMNNTVLCHTVEILSPNTLFNLSSQSQQRCGINLLELLNGMRRKRSVDAIPIPNSLKSAVESMGSVRGVFNYVSIPTFCQLQTSANNCWNGSHTVNSDSILFSSYDIKEQANNSAYNYNIYNFYQQAALLQAPILLFVTDEDFIKTLPSNISIPTINLPTAPPPTTPSPTSTSYSVTTTKYTTLPTIIITYPSAATSCSHSHTLLLLLAFLILLIFPFV
ncbi:PREDICTED: uncharacterized protein LOC109585205 [Amphimedon queenslandica]|uniref:Uncharacterized protein n=1 Tax=Amphimedon queenslandica TaxID=400682 RepID=A0A1X7U0P5_AMPQE|nr:PREDICTED: uncharacterized protein LOC109585205 [Amphimedon queenslandica]|eukprot:XP_019856752.1 PREDICTED: uncharacterized protein LOC109585205 [Amphimedon queenslandica]